MRRNFELAKRLLEPDFCGILVLGPVEAIADQLCFVSVGDMVLWRFAIQQIFQLRKRRSWVPLAFAARVHKQIVTIEKLAANGRWNAGLHSDTLPC